MIKKIRSVLALLMVLLAVSSPGWAVPITFVYPDDPGEGFNDTTVQGGTTLGAKRRAAFEAAANNYASQFAGTVPIVVSAKFDPLGGSSTSATLGFAGPGNIFRDWIPEPGFSTPPQDETWYAVGLANQLAGRDMMPGGADVTATFNSDVDGSTVLGSTSFYYGTDGNTGGHIDFYSVVLHELGHGFGFLSLMSQTGSFATYQNFPGSYDRFMQQGTTSLMSMTDAQRQAAAISDNLSFNGPQATAGNGGTPPKLYAPTSYIQGSSVSHLDEATFSGINELMTPRSSGVAHNLGPVATGVFADIGWNYSTSSDPPQPGPVLTVNSTADTNDGTCGENDCTLREAIGSANSLAGTQTITFDVGPGNQQISLTSALPVVSQSLVIQGPTAYRVTISGGNTVRVLMAIAPLTLQNLTLANGSATGSQGGALLVWANSGAATFELSNCTVRDSSAGQGGGIFAIGDGGSGTLNLINSTISGNQAAVDGGGILAMSYDAGDAITVVMTGCTVSGNSSSDWGGGFFLWQNGGTATASVTNSTFSGNSATSFGGALLSYLGASLSADSITVTGSTAPGSSAVGVNSNNAGFTSRNSLYADNGSSVSVPTLGSGVSLGNNLTDDNSPGFTASGDQRNVGNLTSTLGPLADNGGPTQTHALLAGSPAINAGSTSLTDDQRGQARPQGAADDVGAFELAAVNTAPTISAVDDQAVAEGVSTGALAFTIGDAETPAAGLTLTRASSNTTLVPLANIVFGGAGANRTVTVTPAPGQAGTATITLTVSDGELSASETFVLTVTAAPSDTTPPTVTVTSPADGEFRQ